jgi:hypothetical protein
MQVSPQVHIRPHKSLRADRPLLSLVADYAVDPKTGLKIDPKTGKKLDAKIVLKPKPMDAPVLELYWEKQVFSPAVLSS